MEFRLSEWCKIPFTCSYVPGHRNLWHTIWGYIFLFGGLIPVITYYEARHLDAALLWVIAAVLVLPWVFVHSARRKLWKETYLLFDESEDSQIRAVQLTTE
jgi:membrane-bound metal-dependent hydrolase YbcI (DUF457 family)